jgi:thiamine-monophosphate kinase
MSSGLGEFGRIQRFFAPLTAAAPGAFGLADDAALIGDFVVTVDAIVEGVHFLPHDPPERVAQKLLRVNLSDLAAKGARPVGYVLTMALPKRCDDHWVERFAEGLAQDQAEFGVSLLGGDSVSTPGPITLSLTAFGEPAAAGMVRRAGARAGDLIFVSGTIGDGALGLLAATGRLAEPQPGQRDYLIGRYQLPQPRLALGRALAGTAHAMMDISDGLVGDLEHLCAASGVGAVIEAAAVPLSEAAASVVALEPGLLETVLSGGDDYELLFTVAADADMARLAAETRVNLTCIGRIEIGDAVRAVDRDGVPIGLLQTGFRHS